MKYYILDTNVLIHCPEALLKFQENNIIIPYMVLEELDKKKTESGETGYAAREAIRLISKIKDEDNGILPGGGRLMFSGAGNYAYEKIPKEWNAEKPDNIIIATALAVKNGKREKVILVTNDISMKIKGKCVGLDVEEYKNDRVSSDIYKGRTEIDVPVEDIDAFYAEGRVKTEAVFQNNEFVILKCPGIQGKSALGKYADGYIYPLEYKDVQPMDIVARNAGQTFLKEALMSSCDTHPLVLCNGPAGTGKTLIAIACGLEHVMEKKTYESVLLYRPNVMMGGEEIGFLPGTEIEKISPLLRGCYDNLKVIFGKHGKPDELKDQIDEIFERGYIKAEAVSYLRGRSISNSFIVIDEAQNTSPKQIMSIITRAGEGSKICIMGDVNQIDNPRLDKTNNGLSFAIDRMKGSSLCDIVTFSESECIRSALAKEASKLLL